MTHAKGKKKQGTPEVSQKPMVRVLVTGGAGFIGSHVVDLLLIDRRVERVVVVDAFTTNYDPKYKMANVREHKKDARYRLVRADITDAARMEKLFKAEQFDTVFHLAAACDARKAVVEPKLYLDTNIMGTFNLFESGIRHGVTNFVLASTSSVYGNDTTAPYRESEKTDRALTMYGASKKAMEQLAFTYHHNHGVQVSCLRIFNAYGERMREDLVLPKWVQSITRGESIKLSGAGTRIRDFTYVKDVARAFLLASRIPGFHIVNVGSAKPVSLKKLLGVVENVLGKKAEIVPYASHHGSVEMTHADMKYAKKLLGFTTTMPLEEGVQAYVSWLTGKR